MLKEEQSQKEYSIEEAKKVKSESEKIQKGLSGLVVENSQIEEMVPLNEQEPIALIKTLSLLANQSKAKNQEIMFLNKESALLNFNSFKPQEREDTAESFKSGEDNEFLNQNEFFFNVKPRLIQMNFECEFPRLIVFLKKVLALKRIVLVDTIKIERAETIIPCQKVTLTLSAYTFLAKEP